MSFILLVFFTAVVIELIGTYISVYGLTIIFSINWTIMALAIALDLGKVVTASLIYTHWKTLPKLMKIYGVIAIATTMTITSAGASSYLSGQFQQAIIGTKEGELKVNVLKEQQAKYQDRKKQIDDQIANLPADYSRARITLMKQFESEQKALDAKIAVIDKELPDLQVKQIGVEAKAGPILYVARAFDVTVEQAVKYVILMIIFVFDPLAIFLIIAGNFLLAHRKKQKDAETTEESMPIATAFDPAYNQRERYLDEVLRSPFEFDPAADPRDHEIYKPIFEEMHPSAPPEPAYEPIPEPAPAPKFIPVPPVHEQSGVLDPVAEFVPVPPVSGLLKPIVVDVEENTPEREEITRSSLGLVTPDPKTIADARFTEGFRKAQAIKTIPKR